MEKGKPKLSDIVDFDQLQRLQDAFAAVTGITTVIIDTEGFALTRPSNLYGFCEMMQNSELGVQKCLITNNKLIQENELAKGAASITCPHSGLMTASVPIYLGEEHLASWIIGQIRIQDSPDSVLRQTAGDLGMDAGNLKEVMQALPVFTWEEFERIFAFLQELSQTLVQLSQMGNEMKKSNEELREMSSQLDLTAQMLRKFVDSSDIGMYICDYDTGEILMVNSRFARSFGLSAEEIPGRKCWEFVSPGADTFCSFCPKEKLLDADGDPAEIYQWEHYTERYDAWLRVNSQAIRWVDGRLAMMITYWDITQEHTMRDELVHLAFYDRQMDLPNSLKLTQDLDFAKLRGVEETQFLIAFDIASLRRLNDAYGRLAVDGLLKVIVQWVQAKRYPDSLVYRVEGDEFCLLLNSVTKEQASIIAEEIFDRFTDPWEIKVEGMAVTVLCGVAIAVVSAAVEMDNILNLLERTLDVSRKTGKVAIHDAKMDQEIQEQVRMEMSLKSCVNNNMEGFAVYYQPIVDPAAGCWRGLEALCRWTSPELGPIPPLVFIPVAEHLGLIKQIGRWVLEEAVRRCKEWKLDKLDEFFLSVNLSPVQIMDESLAGQISKILRKYEYPGNKLSLEVTESTEFTFNNLTLGVIENLRFRGIHISLDDFGTGYSTFNNLKNLPVSVVKTEKDFIRGIERDSYMQYFFYILSELAHITDMKLIAEGIETKEQLEIILKNGADYVQGYYFSKPLAPEDLETKLENFTQVNASFYTLHTDIMTEASLLEGKDTYLITPRLFQVLNRCMQALLCESDLDTAINEVLAIVGKSFKASRAYVVQGDVGRSYRNTHEWRAKSIAPQIEYLADIDVEELCKHWLPLLSSHGMVVASDGSKLPKEAHKILEEQGIMAVAVLPMWDGERLAGFVGFEDSRYHDWMPEEILLLRNLCMLMASSIKKEQLKKQLAEQSAIFTDTLNKMDISIFISDLETDEILWANDTMQRLYGDRGSVIGRPCHEALQGLPQRCPFCRKEQLGTNPMVKEYRWEYYNTYLRRDYTIYNSLVRWRDGKAAHLEYALDITETKRAQRRLQYYEVTDALTGTLNRKPALKRLAAMLGEAKESGEPLTIAYIDIDNLKRANQEYGFSMGDMLLNQCVSSLQMVTREYDVIGRLGGDEFLLIMPRRKKEEAQSSLERAQDYLKSQRLGPSEEEYSFSFGIADNREIACRGGEEDGKQILEMAIRRMRE